MSTDEGRTRWEVSEVEAIQDSPEDPNSLTLVETSRAEGDYTHWISADIETVVDAREHR